MNTLIAATSTTTHFATMTVDERIDTMLATTSAEVLTVMVSMELLGDENACVLLAALRNRSISKDAVWNARFSDNDVVATYARDMWEQHSALVAA